jgi:TonB family protein
VLRVRVDLGEGLPRVDESPKPSPGYTLSTVEIPADDPADSIRVTIWLPGATLTKSVPLEREPRRRAPNFGEYVHVEELPEAIHKVAPVYPEGVKGVGGTVMIQMLVGEDGRVHDTRVVKSVPQFDQAAIEAVRQWRFKPALSKGEPVTLWVAVPVRFSPR